MTRAPRLIAAALLLLAAALLVLAALPAAAGPADPPLPGAQAAADSLFEAGRWGMAAAAYRDLLDRDGSVSRNWYRLGTARYRLGDYRKAADAYDRAAGKGFFPLASRYNEACSWALAGRPGSAFDALDKAVAAGYRQDTAMAQDPDLASLHDDPRWGPLLEKVGRAAHPCLYDDRYRRLDFWLGDWTVTRSEGQEAGSNHVERILDGCAIIENWSGALGGGGKSLNYFDPTSGHWKQTWVDDSGGVLEYSETGEHPPEAEIRFLARVYGPSGTVTLRRMTFYRKGPDTVRQLIENSNDGGNTWITAFDGTYVRQTTDR